MKHKLRQFGYFLLGEPFIWVFRCFFQPDSYRRVTETYTLRLRAKMMLRIIPALLLLCYPLTLLISLLVFNIFPRLDSNFARAVGRFLPPASPGGSAPLPAIIALDYWPALTVAAVVGILIGLFFGIPGSFLFDFVRGVPFSFLVGMAGGLAFTVIRAIPYGVILDIQRGVISGLEDSLGYAVAAGILSGLTSGAVIGSRRNIRAGTQRGVAYGLLFGLAFAFSFGIGAGFGRGLNPGAVGSLAAGIALGVTFGLATGAVVSGLPRSSTTGFSTNLLFGALAGTMGGIAGGLAVNILFGITYALSFMILYGIGYSRLLTYPISGPSVFLAYRKSLQEPAHVFEYLHRSSLYWDEVALLPLPYVRRLLLLAAEQDREKALEEIAFIASERPAQLGPARLVTLELVLAEMKVRDSLRDIAGASTRLSQILPEDASTLDARWRSIFTRLNEASREASRYRNAQGLQAKRQSLDEFEQSLKQMRSSATFSDSRFSQQLAGVAEKWLAVAAGERARLEEEVEEAGFLYNPYIPGGLLESRPLEQDNLFVGRRDIGQMIEVALGQGLSRPTFLLYGERRMGKTSALKQMPNLLGKRYLPIFFDLQSVSNRASAPAFLGNLADQIYLTLGKGGYSVRQLSRTSLKDAKSELAVYEVFDDWLKGVEQVLEKADRTLLITFDEFEKLEERMTQEVINLELLLDWFRNIIQHRPRLALLFSGVKTFGEMGSGWAGYFVNVKNVKIGFLKPAEARLLITKPLPAFRGEEIYPAPVVEEIIRQTGCQPLLLQAVCSDLIKLLNEEERERAEIEDVAVAVGETLEGWGSYFDDLWQRTLPDERTCLESLLQHHQISTNFTLASELTGLPAPVVRQALQRLLRRDIICEESENYHLTIPMLASWIERYSERIL